MINLLDEYKNNPLKFSLFVFGISFSVLLLGLAMIFGSLGGGIFITLGIPIALLGLMSTIFSGIQLGRVYFHWLDEYKDKDYPLKECILVFGTSFSILLSGLILIFGSFGGIGIALGIPVALVGLVNSIFTGAITGYLYYCWLEGKKL